MSSRYQKVITAIKNKGKEILPVGSKIILFGSRARNDAREDSDWDIHILVPGPERLSLTETGEYAFPFIQLGWDMGEDIEPIVHSFSGWEKRWFLPLYINIREEGIEL